MSALMAGRMIWCLTFKGSLHPKPFLASKILKRWTVFFLVQTPERNHLLLVFPDTEQGKRTIIFWYSPSLVFEITSLSSICLSIHYTIICSMIFLVTRWSWLLVVPKILLFVLFKNYFDVFLFPVAGPFASPILLFKYDGFINGDYDNKKVKMSQLLNKCQKKIVSYKNFFFKEMQIIGIIINSC